MKNNYPVIGFAGLTHLGLNSLAATAARGFNVVGYHDESDVVEELNNGKNRILEPELSEMLNANREKITYTSSIIELKCCDIVYIAVDVPTDDNGTSDLSVIDTIINNVIGSVTLDTNIVILCQVPPGYTRKLKWSPDQLFYQVETLIFGRAIDRALNPERFIVGCANPEQDLPKSYKLFLDTFRCPILQMKYESAELAKISINMFLISSVSTTNMLAEVCENIGASWSEISPALRLDKRIGQSAYLSPGLGISGGNLERDMASILNLSKLHDTDAKIVETWQDNSKHRKNWVFEMLEKFVFKTQSTPKIGILGLTYKENTHSLKNSPSILLIKKIRHADIKAFDPTSPETDIEYLTQTKSAKDVLVNSDALAIMTPWDEFRDLTLNDLKTNMCGNVIVDPYGILKKLDLGNNGFNYLSLGEKI